MKLLLGFVLISGVEWTLDIASYACIISKPRSGVLLRKLPISNDWRYICEDSGAQPAFWSTSRWQVNSLSCLLELSRDSLRGITRSKLEAAFLRF